MTNEWEEPAEARGRDATSHSVLCTTHLGLVREQRVRAGAEALVQSTLLLKPTVVLEDMLEKVTEGTI